MKKFLRTFVMLALLAVPWITQAQETVTIGDLETAANNTYLPMNSLYNYSYSQQIYTAEEIGMAGSITSITVWMYGNENLYEMPFDIYMVEVDKTEFTSTTDWVQLTSSDLVYSGSITVHNTEAEAYTFTLTTPFDYSGSGNLLIAFDNNTGSWKSGLNGKVFTAEDNVNRAIYYRNDGTNVDPTSNVTVTATAITAQRDVLQLEITPAGGVDCARPDNFAVSDITAHGATFTWESEVGSYSFEYKMASEDEWTVEPVDDESYTLSGLEQNTAYNVRVRAVCGGENVSGYRSANFTTLISCPAPTDFTYDAQDAWALTAHTVTLSWTSESDLFVMEYKKATETEWTLADDAINGTVYTIEDLEQNTAYIARVKADCGDEGTSTWATKNFTTTISCHAPTDFTYDATDAEALTAHTVTLSWTGVPDESELFVLEYKKTTDEEWTLADDAINGTVYTIEDLEQNTAYIARVKADCGDEGTSTWATKNFTTTIACPVPTQLTAVTIPGDATRATISWTAGGTESSWQIMLDDDEDNIIMVSTDDLEDPEGQPTYTFEELTPEQSYTAKVRAYCDDVDQSNWVSVTFQPTNKITIGSGTGTTGNLPTYTLYENSYSQQIYTAEEFGEAGAIFSVDFFMTSNAITRNIDVYVVSTNKTSFSSNSDWIPITAGDLVYSGEVDFIPGDWTTIEFDNPFVYDGENNVAIVVNDHTGTWSSRSFKSYAASSSQSIYVYQDGTPYPINPTVSGTLPSGNPKNQIRILKGELPDCIKPSGITITYNGGTTAEVSWTSEAESFNIEVNGEVEEGVTSPYTLEDLELATSYAVKVQADCGGTLSDWTNPITFTTDLCMPEEQCNLTFVLEDSWGDGWNGASIQVTDVVTNEVIASMAADHHGGGGNLSTDTKTLTLCDGREIQFSWISGNYDSETSFSITDINNEEVLSGASGFSGTVNYTMNCTPTACPKPSGLQALAVGNYTAQIGWTENGEADTWEVMVNDSEEPITVDENPYTLEDLQPETEYTVKVRALCEETSNWSNTLTFTTTVACPAPTDLAVVEGSLTSDGATISWTGYGDEYNVRYRLASAAGTQGFDNSELNGWTTIDADGDGYTWVLASQIGGVYLVDGADITGNGHNDSYDMICSGSYSNVSGVGALTPDNYLVSPQVTLGGSISFYAQAQDASYAEEHFGVAVSTTSNTDPTAFTMLQAWDMDADGGNSGAKDAGEWGHFVVDLSEYAGETGYVAIRHFDCTDMFILNVDDINIEEPDGEEEPWEEASTSDTEIEISGLEPETAYEVRIQSVCGGEESAWASTIFTTNPACFAVEDLEVTPASHGATISWTDVEGTDGYVVTIRHGEEIVVDGASVSESPYTATGLDPETAYTVEVLTDCGGAGYSSPVTAAFTTLIACPAPTDLAVTLTPGDGTVATVSWTEASEATAWKVQLDDMEPYEVSIEDFDEEEALHFDFTGLTPELPCTVKVKALCGDEDGESAWSSITFVPTAKTVIGSGDATSGYVPTYTLYNYSYTQQIYTAEELGTAGYIMSVDFFMTSTPDYTRNLDVYMVSTDKTNFSGNTDWIPVTAADRVFSGEVNLIASDWTTIEFSTPFQYDGENNVAIIVDDNTGAWSSRSFKTFTASETQSIYHYDDDDNYDPTAPGTAKGTTSSKNQIRILKVAELPTCAKPRDLEVAEVGNRSAELTWVEQGEATEWVVSYRAQGEAEFTEVIAEENPYTLENLNPETSYIVRVCARCDEDNLSDWATPVTFTTDVACPAPADLTVSEITAESAVVEWQGFSDDYTLEYAEMPVVESSEETQAGSWLQYDDGTWASGLGNTNPATWTYGAMYPASMLEGTGLISKVSVYESLTYITEDEYTVNIYSGGTTEPGTLVCSETVTVGNEDGFHEIPLTGIFDPNENLWITVTMTGTYAMAMCESSEANNQWVLDDGEWTGISDYGFGDNGWMIRGYVEPGVDLDELAWNTSNETNTSASISDLEPDTRYFVRVKSNCGEEGESNWTMTSFVTDPACLPVSNIASEATGHGATITWDEVDGVAGYYVSIMHGEETVVENAEVSEATYVATGLDPETTYTVAVKSNCGSAGESSPVEASFTTLIACPAPTTVAAELTPGNGTIATITWTEVGEANQWEVQLGDDDPITVNGEDFEEGETPHLNLTGLTAEQEYTVKVRANCGEEDGMSAWSTPVTFIPTDAYEVTVHDGTITNSYLPVYGFYADAYLKGEMVYPAAELSNMSFGSITSMTFYASSPADQEWTSTWQVFLSEVDDASISSFYGPGTVVYEGTLNGTASEMTINFTTPYQYNGGNLLVGVYNITTGNYKSVTWIGETVEGASVQGYNYSSLDGVSPTQRNFLPKTTFGYIPGEAPAFHTVTVNYNASMGTVIAADNVDLAQVIEGTNVTLTAEPATGYQFVNWTIGETTVTTNPYTFQVNEDMEISANFELIPVATYAVTLTYIETQGSVIANVENLQEIEEGTEVSLNAVPATGYQFVGWTVGETTITDNPYVFEITADMAITANFELIPATYAVTIATVENGFVYTEYDGNLSEVVEGTEVTFIATASTGYQLAGWTVNGEAAEGNIDGTLTVTVAADITVAATFELIPVTTYNVSVNTSVGGSVTPIGNQTVVAGEGLTVTATPNTGYHFVAWMQGENLLSNDNPYTYYPEADNTSITATFEENAAEDVYYSIMASANPTEGTVSANVALGQVLENTEVSITATPNAHYEFVNWIENGVVVSTANPYTFTATADHNLFAYFNHIVYDVDITWSPEMGTVTGLPEQDEFEEGDQFFLTATANEGYHFVNWTINNETVEGSNTMVTVSGDMTIVANFAINTYAVTVVANNGTVEANVEDLTAVNHFTQVTFTATPATGYELSGWTVNGVETEANVDGTLTITVTAPTTVAAVFTLKTYTVTLATVENGSIATAYDGDLTAVAHGTAMTFTATPAEGYELEGWTVNGTAVTANPDGSLTVSVTANITVAATFTLIPPTTYTVTIATVQNGTISTTYTGDLTAVVAGTELTFTATPAQGYELSGWTVNGQAAQGTGNELTVTVNSDITVAATFTLIPPTTYTVTIATVEHGTISANIDNLTAVVAGTEVTFTATPAQGYELEGWTVNGEAAQGTGNTLTVTVNANITVAATFTLIPPTTYTVTIATVEHGTISANIDNLTAVVAGTEVTFTATPAEGYELEGWTVNGQAAQANADGTLTVTVTENVTVAATFTAVAPATIDVTFTVNDPNMGSINPSGTQTFTVGTQVTVTATANEGYEFYGWELTVNGVTTTLTENVETTYTVEALAEYDGLTVKALFQVKVGIDDVDMNNVTIYSAEDVIYVRGAEGRNVTVFDLNGRVLNQTAKAGEVCEFRMNNTGIYLVKVGTAAAKRVAVVR